MSSFLLVRVWHVGRMSYSKALKLQKILVSRLRNDRMRSESTLVLVEHDPVYTIGIRSKEYTLEEENRLKTLGADFYRTDRGGLITFHGPGQLVAYPIMNLRNLRDQKGPVGIRRYVEKLQSTIISTCVSIGLGDCKVLSEYPGVWVGRPGEDERKLSAIGVKASQSIVSHGISINCNVDLSWFDNVVPCGIKGKGVTSLSKELNMPVSIEDTYPVFLSAFSTEFMCEICAFPSSIEKSIFELLD